MADIDINHIITLGIGVPGDIEHFILFGLNGMELSERAYFVPSEDRTYVVPEEGSTS